jgi:precorrin-4/cobalt-precorrin-4 C11-methyltransferase
VTVHFIGAGPGAPDLITVRGRNLIARCMTVLYAGSLVPREVVGCAPEGARIFDTASMTLDEMIAEMAAAHGRREEVARVHTGDPSLYGAIAEQMRRLDAIGIPYDVTPGVPAYCAAAAALQRELTLPGISQTIILTRTSMRTSPMPAGEDLKSLGAGGATLAIHLSARNIDVIVAELMPLRGADCPVAVVYRASWPDQTILTGTLGDIADKIRGAGITRTALILVGRALDPGEFADSLLYDPAFTHLTRQARED